MKTGALLFSILIFSFVVLPSCKKETKGTGSASSSYNGTDSHNVGVPCMNCHNTGGSNEYWWIVAGTVYKPDGIDLNPNSTVYLYSGINGTGNLILSLPVDGKGNFFTTSSISFGSGLYAEVKSPSAAINFMQEPVTSGNCNSCHNSSHRITVN